MEEKLIWKRKEILEKFGGLAEPNVNNSEWLYILTEETRNSIMIEGFFIDKTELERVLTYGKPQTRNQHEALKYFETASFVYGLGYQHYKEGDFQLYSALIRQINKSLGFSGDFRIGPVKIAGSIIKPPEFDIDKWIKIYIDFIEFMFNEKDFFNSLAVSHSFFEFIHPFEDGNGRTGRILLNFILISKGFPPIIVKSETQREIYYKGLEEIDKQIEIIFERENIAPFNTLINSKSSILKEIILNSVRENMDRLILDRLEKLGYKLLPLNKIKTNYSENSLRQLVKRGRIIAVKRKNIWFSTSADICIL